MIAALYVQTNGCYFGLPDVDPWDEKRDAKLYDGPYPVIAHPPCQLWGRFAHVNFARWGGEHNIPGNDGGCFKSALNCVRKFGGVLEHPAFTDAWKVFGLPRPEPMKWTKNSNEWICEKAYLVAILWSERPERNEMGKALSNAPNRLSRSARKTQK